MYRGPCTLMITGPSSLYWPSCKCSGLGAEGEGCANENEELFPDGESHHTPQACSPRSPDSPLSCSILLASSTGGLRSDFNKVNAATRTGYSGNLHMLHRRDISTQYLRVFITLWRCTNGSTDTIEYEYGCVLNKNKHTRLFPDGWETLPTLSSLSSTRETSGCSR